MKTRALACGLMTAGAVAALVAAAGPIASSRSLQAAYAVAVVALASGVLLRRTAVRSSSAMISSGRIALPLRSLESLSQAIDAVWADGSCRSDSRTLNQRLGEAIESPMREFLSHRQVMLDEFGVAQFADLMIRFAAVERLLNRALSASADDVIHEAIESLSRAREAMALCLDSRTFDALSDTVPPYDPASPQ